MRPKEQRDGGQNDLFRAGLGDCRANEGRNAESLFRLRRPWSRFCDDRFTSIPAGRNAEDPMRAVSGQGGYPRSVERPQGEGRCINFQDHAGCSRLQLHHHWRA